jgi:hypothetical protein
LISYSSCFLIKLLKKPIGISLAQAPGHSGLLAGEQKKQEAERTAGEYQKKMAALKGNTENRWRCLFLR